MPTETMIVEGLCPVQGYAIIDGWLYYFRARSGWSLSVWAPGRFTVPSDPARRASRTDAEAAIDGMIGDSKTFFSPDILIDTEGEGFPEPAPQEADYPGWWSREYAGRVAAWAIERARAKTLRGDA